jgi:hypothetical protein
MGRRDKDMPDLTETFLAIWSAIRFGCGGRPLSAFGRSLDLHQEAT